MGKQSLFEVYLNRFRNYYFAYRTIPSFEMCMEILGVNSKSVVHRFFQQMIENGYLSKRSSTYLPQDKLVSLPFFESVQAGIPTWVSDVLPHAISVEHYLISHPQHTVLIKVRGESMKDAGIYEGDIVIVETGRTARVGDLVVALVDHEYTLKYLLKDKQGKHFLRAANKDYDDIYPTTELKTFGIVIGSFRKYE